MEAAKQCRDRLEKSFQQFILAAMVDSTVGSLSENISRDLKMKLPRISYSDYFSVLSAGNETEAYKSRVTCNRYGPTCASHQYRNFANFSCSFLVGWCGKVIAQDSSRNEALPGHVEPAFSRGSRETESWKQNEVSDWVGCVCTLKCVSDQQLLSL